MRLSDASWRSDSVIAFPGAGASAGAALSRIVPKIDSVPSRLSITWISRLCCGQSTCDAVLISQNPRPRRPSKNVTSFSCVWPAT